MTENKSSRCVERHIGYLFILTKPPQLEAADVFLYDIKRFPKNRNHY